MLKFMDSVQTGLVSDALQVISENLVTLIGTETSRILGADDEVRKLQRTLERIRAMVGHVEESRSVFSSSISNEAWKVWLEDVEKLCYSADDMLDGISLDLAKYTAESNAYSDSQVRDMLVSSLDLNVPREISKIRQGLEDIAKEMDTLLLTELTKLGSNNKFLNSKSAYNDGYSCASSSLVIEDFVVGRERQRNEIARMLLDESGSNVSVIPIVGMGGIGKTTLAQLLYGDNWVVERFDLRCWASVSMDFDAVRITKSIIESLIGKRCKLGALDPVQVKLRDLLKGKKFLIVLDDYWSEEYRNWDVLSSPFKVGAKGSKIIVTTRSSVVSRIVGSVPSYDLETLTDGDCWTLMKQRVLLNRTQEEISPVEEIGRNIARKCKGLPLAAKTLGSMLHFQNDTTDWSSVLRSEIWELPKDKNDTLPALTLSYHHLPAHLKKCFAYCSIFPKNYDFDPDELALLWIAEGFIRPTGNERLEDAGANYFKDLTWRSFFQFSHVDAQDKRIYKMHDLIHSVARLVSFNTCFCLENKFSIEECRLLSTARHLSLHQNCVQPLMLKSLPWYKTLRSFRVMSENHGMLQVSHDLLLKLKSLRVLGLSHVGLDELPGSIGHLKHLRYLNLSGNPITMLPKSVTKLLGLQTLKLEKCFNLLDLPHDMKKMVNLRHLHFDVKQLNRMPPEFGRLVNLQALSAFLVGRNKGCGIGELKNMRFLRGSICIKNLENISNVNEAKEAMLDMKPCLDKLELEWNDSNIGNSGEGILAGLCPHENLKELILTRYNGFLSPSWLSSSACKLSSIHLRSCRHQSIFATLGKLQHLKSLHIEDILDWFQIGQEFSGFPSLVSLTIKHMPSLTYWEGIDVHSLPRLQSFILMDCPYLTMLPSLINLVSLKCLTINRCPQMQSLPSFPASIQELVIAECDIIKRRCRLVEGFEEGEDWNEIKGIPSVEIDCVKIFTMQRTLYNFL